MRAATAGWRLPGPGRDGLSISRARFACAFGASPPGPWRGCRTPRARASSAWISFAAPISKARTACSAWAASSSRTEWHSSSRPPPAGHLVTRRSSASASSRRWVSARSRFMSSVSSRRSAEVRHPIPDRLTLLRPEKPLAWGDCWQSARDDGLDLLG